MNSFFDRLTDADGVFAYLNLFLLLVASAFGLPIPEDACLIAAGVLAQSANQQPYLLAAAAYCGVVLGDVILFRAGRIAGPAILRRRWIRKHFSADRLRRIRLNLDKRSFLTIFLARHLFYMRTATFILCGAVRMNFARFLIADALAALVTVPVMMAIGYLGAQHFEFLFIGFQAGIKYFVVAIGLLSLIYISLRLYRRRLD